MIRQAIICIAILLFSTDSRAQKIRFADTANEWRILYSKYKIPPGNPVFVNKVRGYYTQGTKMINGVVYTNFFRGVGFSPLLIREDTITKIVYCLNSNNIEFVLYDFNKKVGDSLDEHNVIYKIDSIQINNEWYKVFHIEHTFFGTHRIIVEEIGFSRDISGVFMEASDPELVANIICFRNYGNVPIATPIPHFDLSKCGDTVLNVVEFNKAKKSVVYPQPAYENATISLPAEIKQGTISLLNLTGQTVYRKALMHTDKIIVPSPAIPGVYFYKISTGDGSDYSGKLIFGD